MKNGWRGEKKIKQWELNMQTENMEKYKNWKLEKNEEIQNEKNGK